MHTKSPQPAYVIRLQASLHASPFSESGCAWHHIQLLIQHYNYREYLIIDFQTFRNINFVL